MSAALDADADGRRGAVLLAPGAFFVGTTLTVATSGVAVFGSGEAETTIWATSREYGFVLFAANLDAPDTFGSMV